MIEKLFFQLALVFHCNAHQSLSPAILKAEPKFMPDEVKTLFETKKRYETENMSFWKDLLNFDWIEKKFSVFGFTIHWVIHTFIHNLFADLRLCAFLRSRQLNKLNEVITF